MKRFVIVILCLFSSSLLASQINGNVFHAEEGKNGEDHLLFLTNGKVIFLKHSDKKLFKVLAKKNKSDQLDFLPDNKGTKYRPSILSKENAYAIFANMRTNFKEEGGQCFNMAHIWAYEAYKQSNLKSMKLFMFFTTKYIRAYDFPWWFHVAPLVKVKESEKITSYILDKRYTTFPMPVKEWTDAFIESHKNCKKVDNYFHYNKASKVEDCFLIETSMYYWHPKHIKNRDQEGVIRTYFKQKQIKYAMDEAFQE